MPESTTSIAEFIGDWIYTIFTLPLIAVFGFMFKKAQNTYTKVETDKQIELRTTPMKEILDTNTQAIKDLGEKVDEGHKDITSVLTEIRLEMAETREQRKNRRRLFDDQEREDRRNLERGPED